MLEKSKQLKSSFGGTMTDQIRVVTELGLGTITAADQIEIKKDRELSIIKVDLDIPAYEGKVIKLRGEQIFELTDYAIVRIINVNGAGVFSNLQFCKSIAELYVAYKSPKPQGETRFALELNTGKFSLDSTLGIVVERYLWLQPFLDRWVREQSESLYCGRGEDPTVKEFDHWKSGCCGTSGGIFCPSFLDLNHERILRFCIAVQATRGIVFEKNYPTDVEKFQPLC